MPYIETGMPQRLTREPGVKDVYSSENVFANCVRVALWQEPYSSEGAALAEINRPTYRVEESTNKDIEGDTNDGVVAERINQLVESGAISNEELSRAEGAQPSATNTASPATPLPVDQPTKPVEIGQTVDDTLLYDSPTTGTKYYVKTVTKVPGVVFPYDVETLASRNGFSVEQVIENLRNLVVNVIDPIKAKYPDVLVTCTFREKTSSNSQHNSGSAVDLQYTKCSKDQYYERAQWIKDNIQYDQFLLEYKTTGTRNPWHHLSFSSSNRRQTMTFMNHRKYSDGLANLSHT